MLKLKNRCQTKHSIASAADECPTAREVQENAAQFQDKHRGSRLWRRVSLTFGRPKILDLENNTSSLIFVAHQGNDCHK